MKAAKKLIGILACAVLIITVMVFSASANPSYTYEVGEGKQYATVQAALDAVSAQAVTQETDFTVNVAAGTYSGTVFWRQQVNKNVSIIGESAGSVKFTDGVQYSYYKDGASRATASYALLVVDGDARAAGTDTLSVKNIAFDYTAPAGVANVDMVNLVRYELRTGKNYSYAHNITFDSCTFTDTACARTAVAVRTVSTSYNLKLQNCKGSWLHSFGQGPANPYTVKDCTLNDSKCAFNFQTSQNVLVDGCDFGVCVDECLRIGQNSTSTAVYDGTFTVTNCKGSYLSEDPARGFVVIREQTPKNFVINNNNIDGTITCISKLPAVVATLNIDLSDNYWGSEEPDFSEVLVGFADSGIASNITPGQFFVDTALDTLNTDCSYVGYHTYDDNWYVSVEPTCCAEGVERRDCTNPRCTDETAFEVRAVAATGAHVYSDTYEISLAPTCRTTGEERAYCTTEGCDAFTTRTVPIDDNAHKMGEWAVYTNETCTATGLNRRYCQQPGCGHYEQSVRPVCAHSYTRLEQVVTKPTCCASGTAVFGCATCTLTQTLAYGKPTGLHTWGEWDVTKEATVFSTGLKTHSCTVEGCTASENAVIPKESILSLFDWVIYILNALKTIFGSIA